MVLKRFKQGAGETIGIHLYSINSALRLIESLLEDVNTFARGTLPTKVAKVSLVRCIARNLAVRSVELKMSSSSLLGKERVVFRAEGLLVDHSSRNSWPGR